MYYSINLFYATIALAIFSLHEQIIICGSLYSIYLDSIIKDPIEHGFRLHWISPIFFREDLFCSLVIAIYRLNSFPHIIAFAAKHINVRLNIRAIYNFRCTRNQLKKWKKYSTLRKKVNGGIGMQWIQLGVDIFRFIRKPLAVTVI